jgi:hypothetical protein
MTEPLPPTKQEPVMTVGLVVSVLMAISLAANFSTDVQAYLDAALLAAGGVVTAFLVDWRKALPLLAGLFKAVLALLAGLAVDVPANWQAMGFALITALSSYFLQSQVVASVSKKSFGLAG